MAMAISLLSFFFTQALFFLVLVFFFTYVTAQAPPGTNFSCPIDSPTTCSTYISYLAQAPDFLDLRKISHLFGISRTPLSPNQLLLVPIHCGCTGSQSFANITYQIQQGDSFYSVSTISFANLTRWREVEPHPLANLNPKIPTLNAV